MKQKSLEWCRSGASAAPLALFLPPAQLPPHRPPPHTLFDRGPPPSPAAVYVGNYEYDASERELERTFEKYGDVDRVEFKSGQSPLLCPLSPG